MENDFPVEVEGISDEQILHSTGTLNVHSWAIKVIVDRRF
jgi:hypothetical protein